MKTSLKIYDLDKKVYGFNVKSLEDRIADESKEWQNEHPINSTIFVDTLSKRASIYGHWTTVVSISIDGGPKKSFSHIHNCEDNHDCFRDLANGNFFNKTEERQLRMSCEIAFDNCCDANIEEIYEFLLQNQK